MVRQREEEADPASRGQLARGTAEPALREDLTLDQKPMGNFPNARHSLGSSEWNVNYTYNAELKVVSCLLQEQVILWQQQMLNLVSLRFSLWNLTHPSCQTPVGIIFNPSVLKFHWIP